MLPDAAPSRPLLRSEKRPRIADASLRKPEREVDRLLIGRALNRARELRGWNLDEFAAAVERDPRQCARWFEGKERAQMDVIFAVVSLRPFVILAFAEVAGEGVEVVTEIRVRRIA